MVPCFLNTPYIRSVFRILKGIGCMLYHKRMSMNCLKMCSLGQLVVLRKSYSKMECVVCIDCEIFSRIPKKYFVLKKEEPRRKKIQRKGR